MWYYQSKREGEHTLSLRGEEEEGERESSLFPLQSKLNDAPISVFAKLEEEHTVLKRDFITQAFSRLLPFQFNIGKFNRS